MELHDFISEAYPCAYLENQKSQFKYLCIVNCSPYYYNGLLERGYRRFGELYFSPICPHCSKCKTIRYLVKEFRFSKNMKRIFKNNIDTILNIRRPLTNDARVMLYTKYHTRMSKKKNWEVSSIDMLKYSNSFVDGGEIFGYEMCFYRDGRLIGVSYFDIVEKALSANYFFYDHDYEKLSLGTLNILLLMNIAKKLDLMHFYPGYWIENHSSMGYKERFRPFEMLLNKADIFDITQWKKFY